MTPSQKSSQGLLFITTVDLLSLSLTFYLVFSSLISTLPLHHYPCSFSSLLPHSPTPAPFMALIIISFLHSLHNFHRQLLLFSHSLVFFSFFVFHNSAASFLNFTSVAISVLPHSFTIHYFQTIFIINFCLHMYCFCLRNLLFLWHHLLSLIHITAS